MGRLELQFNGIPLLLGYIPVNREPRWGLLNGQLLMADVNTTDSRANHSSVGYAPGHSESSLSRENLPGPRTPSPGYGIGRENVNDIRLDGLFRLRGFTALQGEQT